MEIEAKDTDGKIGKNIKQIREILGMSRTEVALRADMSAGTLAKIEQGMSVDDKILDKIAAAMEVPTELLRNYDHENTVNYIISNNTFEGEADALIGSKNDDNRIFNPIEKVTELYERLLEEQKKNMQREIDELRKKLGE